MIKETDYKINKDKIKEYLIKNYTIDNLKVLIEAMEIARNRVGIGGTHYQSRIDTMKNILIDVMYEKVNKFIDNIIYIK